MNETEFDAITRSLNAPQLSRRVLARGLVGLTVVAGASRIDLGDADSRKRKKKGKGKKKRRKKGSGGDDGGGNGGGGDECNQTVCEGQCVDLGSDPDNCGACGNRCAPDATCVEGQCVIAFGRGGAGEGEFDSPQGLVIDAARNIVVADSGNHRIQIIDQDGNVIRAFGRQGTAIGELNFPSSVALDAEGNIYVVDKSNDRVQQFTADGQVLRAFGSRGNAIGQFDNPFGIAVDRAGTIIVADTNNSRVQFFFPPLAATQRGGKRPRAKRSSR